MKIMLIAFALSFILFTNNSVAQTGDRVSDSIVQKLYWYSLQKPSATLFVHFDKNVYTNNENVWFTGYLLNTTSDVHHTLSVALIRNDDRSILAEGKFLIGKQRAFGNLFLPDSLPTGNYNFICYTNHIVNGYPSALFIQPVTIKTANANGFITNLSLIDSIKPGMDSARVLLKSYTQDITLVKGADVLYFIGDRTKPLKTGKLKTDKFGEAKISIPLKEITITNNVLQTEVNNGKEVKTFSVSLPVYKKVSIVKFYPEGGGLVNGVNSRVGWEVLSSDGEPSPVSGTLYENDQPVQTVHTNTYGMGKFSIIPRPGRRYSVKLTSTDKPDTAYVLPAALPSGPVINVSNALTSDTLSLVFSNTQPGNKWIVVVHNYRATFLTSTVVSTGRPMMLKVPLQEIPKGLNNITILDSTGRAWAERVFFAHFDKRTTINISTDAALYSARQKVTVKFSVTDAQQQAVKSLVSIACVQNNRFEPKKMTDIESYTYLKHELTSLPFKSKVMSSKDNDKDFLETLLLVKGWRRYTWQDVSMVNIKDTAQRKTSLTFTGQASIKSKRSVKALQIVVLKLPAIDLVNTDSTGNFSLPDSVMVAPPDKQLQLSVNSKNQDQYTIKVNDPYGDMNKYLSASLAFDNFNLPSFSQTSQTVVLKNEEGAKRLLDVVVTAKKDDRIYKYGANECGDYVCMYNILNCTNHPFGGSLPVVGRAYGVKGSGGSMIYEGCAALKKENLKHVARIDGIYTAKAFYVSDYSKYSPPSPDYLSTIFWNYSILTSDNGESELSFYTSDIPGKFRIVIQGITTNDVVYGEHFFDVKQ